ncbi:alpha/beta fold hydrolase [Novosphingobium piscinae]|uniref:Alpha/beta hydrolase n=1 Tax=Novosphingobium piscinae TaxID=1507448 RepID=A0A7X1FWE8_9SPHN|nr:alpha/beta hydrolase [Novosphingobium piscinae]MBC2667627.1 alpha/beta hydrolase [Novosphingobium piscinae]
MFRHLVAAAMLVASLFAVPAAAFTSERIIVTVEGSGPDVILVPGLTSNPRIYAAMVAAVPGYRYHRIQVRGFSGTAPAANAQGDVAAAVAEELARYIREDRLVAPSLIGHSLGGTIGMMLASRHPAALGRLMVVDMVPFSGAFFGAKDGPSARAIVMGMQASMASNPEGARTMMTQMIAGMVNSAAERPAVIDDARTSDPALVARAYADLQGTDLRSELAAVTVPVTVLYVKPAMAAAVPDEQFDGLYKAQYAALRQVTLTRVPDSAHFIMLDAPTRFIAEVRQFLPAPVSGPRPAR